MSRCIRRSRRDLEVKVNATHVELDVEVEVKVSALVITHIGISIRRI